MLSFFNYLKWTGIRTLLLVILVSVGRISAVACEVCQKNQPKGLKNITHGTGPQGNIDYLIIWLAVIITAVALFFSIKFLLKPNESDNRHIKYSIVDDQLHRHGRQ